jgi:hypothetical protein
MDQLRGGTSAEVTDTTILKLIGYPDGWYYQNKLIYPLDAAGFGPIINYGHVTAKIENNTISL